MSDAPGAMRVDILTTFPEMIEAVASSSILGRARASGRLDLRVHNLRDYTENRHRTTDDYPFGGGAGMVMKPEPVFAAWDALVEGTEPAERPPLALMAPDGETFTQATARELSALPWLVLICGHYEGIDERVRQGLVTRELSIGDYVLTGGELAALVVLDATVRLLPGVLGNEESPQDESFSEGLLEYPHYTRPAAFRGMEVPEVLLSGHHARIAGWRRAQALARTRERRPDLWKKFQPLSKADQKLIDAYDAEKLSDREGSI